MADFKAIETQEELDRIVTERLKREQEKYSDYEALKTRNSELETEVGTLKESVSKFSGVDEQIRVLTSENARLKLSGMKTRIALGQGLPIEFAERLSGEDEASLKADAE